MTILALIKFKSLYLKLSVDMDKPSVNILKEIFSIFGEIRMIDIPMLNSSSGCKRPSLNDYLVSSSTALNTFEAFIQYKDYISFVKAMDTFRGMKLLYIDVAADSAAFTANIRVDFDRTRHLSDKEIKKREIDKLKAIEIEKIKNAQLEKEKEKEAKQKEIAK
jgi:arginine/serine-rich splicing factor 17